MLSTNYLVVGVRLKTVMISRCRLLYFMYTLSHHTVIVFRTDGEPDSGSEVADEFKPTTLPGLFKQHSQLSQL